MKEFLTIVSLLVSGVVAESPAPYAASGWRPSGPTFDLPQRGQNPQTLDPRNKPPQKQQTYLPPREYGTPAVDLSVQGLPVQGLPTQGLEQQPIFMLSPINGQQYVGPNFNQDLRNLDQSFKQSQFQQQQEIYNQFNRQRQLEASQSNNNGNGLSNQQTPRQFVQQVPQTRTTSTSTSTLRPEFKTEPTTELNLNERETENSSQDKVTVEVSKQNVQEYPAELFLNPLAQLRLQERLANLQLSQLSSPVVLGAAEKQSTGYDAQTHFAAFPSVLAQQQILQSQEQLLQQQQLIQSQQQLYGQPQTQYQSQPQFVQLQPQYQEQPQVQNQQPAFLVTMDQAQANQYQPANQYEAQPYPQYQPVVLQPEINQVQPNYPKQLDTDDDVVQSQYPLQQPYQPAVYQQPNQYQPQTRLIQAQLVTFPNQAQFANQASQVSQYANQVQPNQAGNQETLQSGLDVNRKGNGIDQNDDEDNDGNDGATVTAVATAFGARTQPRINTRYGTPSQTSTENQDQATESDAAAARGSRRKSAKQRSGRVRPVFTLDKSGHLVLSKDQ